MTITIEESGMQFGPFVADDLFAHEQVLKKVQFGDHVKMVEFIVRLNTGKTKAVAFVEARSSIPRNNDDFLDEIRHKMNHSLIVWFTSIVGRHPKVSAALPSHLRQIEHLKFALKCYLVIPGVPDEHLAPFTDKFRQIMAAEIHLWPIKPEHIRVLNRARAIKVGLLAPT